MNRIKIAVAWLAYSLCMVVMAALWIAVQAGAVVAIRNLVREGLDGAAWVGVLIFAGLIIGLWLPVFFWAKKQIGK